MATQFCIAKTDENEAVRPQTKKVTKDTVVGKRAVLGELGNKVLRNGLEPTQKGKEGGGSLPLKQSDPSFKHVKARVDTHWKKAEVSSSKTAQRAIGKPVTRSDSLKNLQGIGAGAKSGTTNATSKGGSAKPVVVHVTKTSEVKKVKIVNLKREESRLSRRSLTKLKQIRSKQLTESRKSKITVDDDSLSDSASETSSTPDTHSQKLLEEIENIDINDTWNPMLVSEYVNDIYNYLNYMEEAFAIRENFLEGHKQINHKMRTILIDWINEVHYQFKLEIDTYHMTVSVIDRYLQLAPETAKIELQLVGVTSMFIASKYEELFPPDISDFAYITDDTYNKKQILAMEKKIVMALDFQLGKPLATHFLRRFSKAAKAADKNHLVAKYLIELASVDYSTAHYKPSEIAAAALYISLYLFPLANCNIDSNMEFKIWSKTLEYYTHYTVARLGPVVQRLAKVLKQAPSVKVQAVYSKYQSSKFEKISLLPELRGARLDKLIDGQLLL